MNGRKKIRIFPCLLALFLFITAVPATASAAAQTASPFVQAAVKEPYIAMADFLIGLQTEEGAITDGAGLSTCNKNAAMMYALMGLGAAYRKSGDPRYLAGLEKGIAWLAEREEMNTGPWYGSFYGAYDPAGNPIRTSYGSKTEDVRGESRTSALFAYLVYLDRQLNPASTLPSRFEKNTRAALWFVLQYDKDPSGLFYNAWHPDRKKWMPDRTFRAADQASVWMGLMAGSRLFGGSSYEKASAGLRDAAEKLFFSADKKRYAWLADANGEQDLSMDTPDAVFPQGYLPLVWGDTPNNRASLEWLSGKTGADGKTTCYKGDKGYALTAALLLSGAALASQNTVPVKNRLLSAYFDEGTGGVREYAQSSAKRYSDATAFAIMALTGWKPNFTGISAPYGKPVIAAHSTVWSDDDGTALVSDIPNLAVKGVNLLFVEVGYHYQYQSHPELADSAGLSFNMARNISAACRANGIRVVPELNCLGHQSLNEKTDKLLTVYPDFDETPDLYPDNAGIYTRSWCPLNPDVNKVVFALMDELVDAFQADAFHVGMDEVMLIGEDACPRCRGRDKGELFAKAVNDYYDHLVKEKGLTMFIWGDRLLNGWAMNGLYTELASSYNGTYTAVDKIPKDIVICDWHYQALAGYPSIQYFLDRGFQVLTASYDDVDAAGRLVDVTAVMRQYDENVLGHIYTNWLMASCQKMSEWPAFMQTESRIYAH